MDHVQVQTDAFAGKLTDEERKTAFAKTRVKGPGDLKSYRRRTGCLREPGGILRHGDRSRKHSGSGPEEVQRAQRGSGTGAEAPPTAGMDDWKTHVKFMQYNTEHPDPDAAADRQTDWMKPVPRRAQEHQSVQEGH